ncbi:MAG: NAD(P)H-dependent oxidoreductase subunit E [Elusimicrobia bacterium]|nr:NAD(P)H-dependent oxidoreductase subunit E [Elusimicrobiota bacterium]MBP9699509.1 NAD(P)H-dependent oxidoreductase subunit E [Elusimicrobiota bacterium]
MTTDLLELEKIRLEVDKICAPWKGRPGNLIMVLHGVQNKYGYVPRMVSFEVAKYLEIPLARIYEVITFYNYFKLQPPGHHIVSVCLGTACYLKGSSKVLEATGHQLGIKAGESTPDKKCHLQVVRCLGCCGLAPVMTVGERVYSGVTPDRVPSILAEYKGVPR